MRWFNQHTRGHPIPLSILLHTVQEIAILARDGGIPLSENDEQMFRDAHLIEEVEHDMLGKALLAMLGCSLSVEEVNQRIL